MRLLCRVFYTPPAVLKVNLLFCKHPTTDENRQSWQSWAELTYILLFLHTAKHTGLRELWCCSACLLAFDWKQCVSRRNTCRLLFAGCGPVVKTVGNILDVPFISKKNSQVRSALVLHHAHNVEARRHLYSIESPGWGIKQVRIEMKIKASNRVANQQQ